MAAAGDSPVYPIVATEGSSTLSSKFVTLEERLDLMLSLSAKLQGHIAYLRSEVERAREGKALRASESPDRPTSEADLGTD